MSGLISLRVFQELVVGTYNVNKKNGSMNVIIRLYRDKCFINKCLTPAPYKRKIMTWVIYSRLYHNHGILHQLVYYLPSLLVAKYEFVLVWQISKQVSSIYSDCSN